MIAVITVVHIFLAVALVAVIMLQKSEGGALGIGGGGMSGFMTGRSTANLLTRTTAGIARRMISSAESSLRGTARFGATGADTGTTLPPRRRVADCSDTSTCLVFSR